MAVLQKIRNRAGILVIIFVGVALFLFIIDPTTFQALFNKQNTNIAVINGEDVDYKDYQAFYESHRQFALVAQRKTNLEAEEDEKIREQAWTDLLQDYLMKPYFEEVGLSVSDVELEDLLYGSNIHYVILQNFTNQQTGQVDTASIRNFFDKAGEDANYQIISDYWKTIIKRDRLSTKYNNMVAKGFYTPKALAKMDYEEKSNQVDFEYVFSPYKNIPDESIKVTDADIKTYYDNHQYMFMEEKASRDIEYVVFDIIPSAEDTLAIKTDIQDLHTEFLALTEGYFEFANRYCDVKNPEKYYSKEELPAGLTEEFFKSPVGTTSDVILDNNNNIFYFARIEDIAPRPDSVMASHILIIPDSLVTIEQCRLKADSLNKLIEKGEDFAMLALMNSGDPGSKSSGGDLGWFTDGMMVKEFNDACFSNKKGDVVTVETQFGVHIIKITDQTVYKEKVKLAILNKEINFSDRTSNYYFSIASNFVSNNNNAQKFDAAIIKDKLVKRIASKLGELDSKITGIDNARDIVRWVYGEKAKVGDISEVYNFQDKYIVVKIAAIRAKGVSPMADVKELITPIIIKDKKAEKLVADLNKDVAAKMDLNAIATKYTLTTDTLTAISFSSFSLPGIGIEPNVNATATNIAKGVVSQAIKGNNGVFVIRVFNTVTAPVKTDFAAEQINIMKTNASQVYKIFESVQKKADIEDFRAKYF
jgi:peptidyl-prolyl cis-trans isomerase D